MIFNYALLFGGLNVNIFLPINFSIWLGAQKNSLNETVFEYTQHNYVLVEK